MPKAKRKKKPRELPIGLRELRARLPILKGYMAGKRRHETLSKDNTLNMMERERWV
jgi:hypothetical protein